MPNTEVTNVTPQAWTPGPVIWQNRDNLAKEPAGACRRQVTAVPTREWKVNDKRISQVEKRHSTLPAVLLLTGSPPTPAVPTRLTSAFFPPFPSSPHP